jgi:predicted DNA-binding protein
MHVRRQSVAEMDDMYVAASVTTRGRRGARCSGGADREREEKLDRVRKMGRKLRQRMHDGHSVL